MFVDSIDIKEFRGIKSCKEPLVFSRLNILFGRNNAGKSTILEALSLLPQPEIWDSITGREKIRVLSQLHKSRDNFESLLYFYTGQSKIDYVINHQEFSIHINMNSSGLYITNKKIQDNNEIYKILNTKNIANLVIYFPFDFDFFNEMENKIQTHLFSIGPQVMFSIV